jgi:hypothetical protein
MMPRPKKSSQTVDIAAASSPPIDGIDEVPAKFRPLFLEIVSLTDEFCQERLNVEYQAMCREAAISLCQEGSPAVRGKPASWACGIVSAIGWVNFLTDPSQTPHARSEEIAEWFGVSSATMHNKARVLREGLDLIPLDPDFTLPSRLGDNPLVWMFDIDGMIVDIREAPREVQQAAFEAGAIPFVPADREEGKSGGKYAVTHQRASLPAKRTRNAEKSKPASYQLKITLDDCHPAVWRRLRVPDCTLEELHELVQTAMGWHNGHLHEFSAGKERFAMDGMDEFGDLDDDAREESAVRLSELVDAGHKKLNYWYDFGDDWRHTIKIEKTLEAMADGDLAVCVAGAGACPPEDIGGVWGYAEFLEALADPTHERHEELAGWYGGEFDPTAFDVGAVNELLRARG